jgi:hypothetical protein
MMAGKIYRSVILSTCGCPYAVGCKPSPLSPRRGEGRNQTEAVSLYLTGRRKLAEEKLVIIDGGFDTEYRVDIWIVPNKGESADIFDIGNRFDNGKRASIRNALPYKFYSRFDSLIFFAVILRCSA